MFDGGSLGFEVRCASGDAAIISGDVLRIIGTASKPIAPWSRPTDRTKLAQQSSSSCNTSDCVSRSMRTAAT